MRIGLQAWGSEGDIMPFTALAAGLVRSGHEVTLAVTDNVGRDYSGLAQRFGYHLVAVPNPEIHTAEDITRIWLRMFELENPIRQAEVVMKHGFDPATERMYQAAQDLCAANELVIGHFFVFPLQVAAEKAGVPSVTVNIVHNCVPSREIQPPGLPGLGRWTYPLGWALVRKMAGRIFLPRVNALRTREGLAPDRDVMTQTWAAERLNLIAVSPAICRRPADWEPRHQVCGFLNPPVELGNEAMPEGLQEYLSAGEPPVYLTFGSMMVDDLGYMRQVADIWMEAVRLAGCRAVMQFPHDALSMFPADERVFKVRRVPYKQVFPRCAMVVHHGGAGTTQSSLLAGRPSIIVAHMADQSFWGAELERLGVAGKTLRRTRLNGKQLAKGILQVLATPGMAARAAELGGRMAAEDGIATAVRLIERTFE